MIDSKHLLADLKRLLPVLEADISAYASEHSDVEQALQVQYDDAKAADRTAEHWVDWRAAQVTQAAAAWVLALVFQRFLEDNRLIEQHWIAGPAGESLNQARDALTVYFRDNPSHAERDYLQHRIDTLCNTPVVAALLDRQHNPLWQLPLSSDGAKRLLDFFQQIDPETNVIHHDFTDASLNTRFLGDLYQDLSEAVRKRYALLQTPDFVESFILDYTLKPAMKNFSLAELRMIDPTCGSGHFLLSSFDRVFNAWVKKEPSINTRELAQRALDAVHGIDINPYAIAIARFRLLIAAMQASGSTDIQQAPDFQFNLAVGDSLLHGRRHEWEGQGLQADALDDPIEHVLNTEDKVALERILGQRYHVVVGNPPYITVKDKALNKAYREKYPTCHRKYSLGVPFTERFFDLAVAGEAESAGYVGMITTNSFMKREFGKKLIESYLPRKDLTHVIDTSGAYIPGHGTPTVILYARNRAPVSENVRAVLGIRGEPSKPDDPSKGKVWCSIVELLEKAGEESEFVSSVDQERAGFGKHPWSLTGGGASDLKEAIDSSCSRQLSDFYVACGRTAHTGSDDAYFFPTGYLASWPELATHTKPLIGGAQVRDWSISPELDTLFPYNSNLKVQGAIMAHEVGKRLWSSKQYLVRRREPGGTHEEIGLTWYEWSRWHPERFMVPLGIAFAEVATHNNFALDRGGKVFKQTAPVIKLVASATEDEHYTLLGLLNSSVAGFWMKQVFHNKGDSTDSDGARVTGDPAFDTYQYAVNGLKKFPIPNEGKEIIVNLTKLMDQLLQTLGKVEPIAVFKKNEAEIKQNVTTFQTETNRIRGRMIALQEEIDWYCYSLYQVCESVWISKTELPMVNLGERAFEIVLARKIISENSNSTWFARHNSKPITEIPGHWPEDYQKLIQTRIDAIESNKLIRLIEQPEYKRRWATDPWGKRVEEAAREVLLVNIEECVKGLGVKITTAAQISNILQSDNHFHQVAEILTGDAAFDPQQLVVDLIKAQDVPQMATARYKSKGMEKFRAWQHTWDLQRLEDAGETLSEQISAPPKYASSDFRQSSFWSLRGKLDVPKERFFSLPGCEKIGDSTPVIGWAGLDHLQRAQAIAEWYLDRKESDGFTAEQLMPMLVALDELIPWLNQWHNEVDPEFGVGMGDYFAGFLADELRSLEVSPDQLLNWELPATSTCKKRATKKRTAKKSSSAKPQSSSEAT